MTTVEIINDLLKQKHISAAKMMNELGFSSGLYSQWKSGKQKPSSDKLEKIADYFGVSVDYLLGTNSDTKTPLNFQLIDMSKMISVPIVGRVAAGRSCYADKYITGYELVHPDSIKTGYDYIYLKVKGDSMEPQLFDGDLVLVQLQDVVEHGDYAVVIVDGEDGLVKRFEYGEGYIRLVSYNPYYPPRVFEGSEMTRVKIVGKVVESKRKF